MALTITNNIASLTAQNNLSRNSSALATSLERLSSGLKINRGADGPAGLVISEQQRAQIIGLQTAINNTSNAVNVVQTGEGALNEINSLLDQVRGLAVDSANTGVNDANALAANQSEIANALQTIDRIANTTQFGTKKLLDGTAAQISGYAGGGANLGAVSTTSDTQAGTYAVAITQQGIKGQYTGTSAFLGLDKAVLSGAGLSSVAKTGDPLGGTYSVSVTTQGVKGNVQSGAVAGATNATAVTSGDALSITGGSIATSPITVTAGAGETIGSLTTKIQNALDGDSGAAGKYTVSFDATAHQFNITDKAFGTDAALTVTAADAQTATDTGFAQLGTAGTAGVALVANVTGPGGPYNGITGSGTNGDQLVVTTSAGNSLTIGVAAADATHTIAAGAAGTVQVTQKQATLTLNGHAISLDGTNAADLATLVNTLNQSSATTGVTASNSGGDLQLTANGYGGNVSASDSGTALGLGGLAGASHVSNGQALQGTVDGQAVTGSGAGGNVLQSASGNSKGLAVTVTGLDPLHSLAGATSSVTVTDGLQFQIGANASQTASISIQKATSDSLGLNVAGLNNAATTSLHLINVTDPTGNGAQDAIKVVDQAISDVTDLRGRLGAFQANTLQSTANNLRTTLQNTTAAESTVRDTDFAAETANFTKNQVLVQAGTTVLANANQTAGLVLNLLK